MAWDSSRPVPWRRLIREWLIYALIMCVVLALFMRNESLVGLVAGVLVSGPMYLMVGFVLAKFGYARKSLKEMRRESTKPKASATVAATAGPRPKPAPTKRTGGGSAGRRR